MTRLIVISFAALGWCFYVMSGGPDFEPRGLRSEQPTQVAAIAQPAPQALASATDLVTNVATRTPAVRAKPIEPQPVVVEYAADTANLDAFRGLSVFDDQTSNITLASLEDGVSGLQQVAPEAPEPSVEPTALPEPEKDIREISGTRVNLRDGPGTIYPIIGKAGIGQKVEVLSDSGTGWLRLRVLPQQQVGWMSASLVAKSAN